MGLRHLLLVVRNLVKIKVKNCRGVPSEVADWLRASRLGECCFLVVCAFRRLSNGNSKQGFEKLILPTLVWSAFLCFFIHGWM